MQKNKEVARHFYQHAENPGKVLILFDEMADTFGAGEVISWLAERWQGGN